MLKNYLKIAWRNLLKTKGYSAVNIGGLSVGMAVAVLIGLWVWDELPFNTHHKNYDRIVQVMQHETANGVTETGPHIPMPLRNALQDAYGSDFTRLALSSWTNEHFLSFGEKKIVRPFDYKFIDEEYAAKFSDEERIGNFATIFAILAIFISCLGLFGLVSYVAEQRTKEIGIRKVLGASVSGLWGMLSKDFVTLVIASCLIATSVAYFFMHNWLQQYDYRTEISWWVFATAAFGALFITLLTVSFQSIKAAIINPAKSLRTE